MNTKVLAAHVLLLSLMASICYPPTDNVCVVVRAFWIGLPWFFSDDIYTLL